MIRELHGICTTHYSMSSVSFSVSPGAWADAARGRSRLMDSHGMGEATAVQFAASVLCTAGEAGRRAPAGRGPFAARAARKMGRI